MVRRIKLLSVLAVAVIAIAAVPTGPTPITLAWDYPDADATPDLVFKLYYSTSVNTPMSDWTCVTNVPGTHRQVTQAVLPKAHYWYLTASNFWGESVPSNVASTPAAPRSDTKLRISR